MSSLSHTTQFADRFQAGRFLASQLSPYEGRSGVIVLAVARGGIPVAYEIANALDLPLDVLAVRRLTVPARRVLAIGAVASDGCYLVDHDAVQRRHVSNDAVLSVFEAELDEAARCEVVYRRGRSALDLSGKVVIICDDEIDTGSTMRVAIESVRRRGASRVVVATGVAPESARSAFHGLTDAFVCAFTTDLARATGKHYADYHRISDWEAGELLARATAAAGSDCSTPSHWYTAREALRNTAKAGRERLRDRG